MAEINNFDEWIVFGMNNKWCSPPLCETHDGVPLTKYEESEFDEGHDPCVHVIRLYESPDDKQEAEEGHAPSHYRNIWSKADDDKG